VASFLTQPGHGIDNRTVGTMDSMKHWWDIGNSWGAQNDSASGILAVLSVYYQ
jgi:hypothetical protein